MMNKENLLNNLNNQLMGCDNRIHDLIINKAETNESIEYKRGQIIVYKNAIYSIKNILKGD